MALSMWRRMDFSAAIHNVPLAKKYLLEQKNKTS